jgi:Ca-activated chloride channel family protein
VITTELIDNFHFLRPWWLLAIFPACLLCWYFQHFKRSSVNWHGAIHENLLKYLVESGNNRLSTKWEMRFPWIILLSGWVIASLALSGPSWEKLPQPVLQKQDALVIVLDLSLSMLAEDIKPSRLVRARHKILDILEERKEGLTALIAYSGDAHIVSPLTDDNPTIANLAPALSPGMMPFFGSNPVDALNLSKELLKNANINHGKVLLISDDITEDNLEEIGSSLAESGHELSILGMGTIDGAPIPTKNGFLKDNAGSIIVPQLHRQHLENLAKENNGKYTDVSLTGEDIQFLLPPLSLASAESDSLNVRLTERLFDQWLDRGPLLALCLLPFALLAFRRGWILLLPLLIIEPNSGIAFEWDDLWQTKNQRAVEALDKGDAKSAASLFQNKDWEAAANYQAGEFTKAEKIYGEIENADAFYNRGNALAKAGKIDAAISAYEKALEQKPEMEDALFNKQLLEKLKQEQEQEQEQESEENEQEDDKSDSEEKDSDQKDKSKSEQDDDSEQDPSDEKSEDDQESEQQEKPEDKESKKDEEESKDKPEEQNQQEEQQPEESEEEQQAAAEASESDKLDQQQQQAMEQWLRKIPDEPSGLLRRKFDYESRLKQLDSNQQDQPQW